MKYALIGLILLGCLRAWAASLGAVGPAYPVAEPDLLKRIERALRDKQASGEIERAQRAAAGRAAAWMRTPNPVQGLTVRSKTRSHYFDPTLVLDRHITDGTGALLFHAGTRGNPLDIVKLSRPLLFFDARDPRQSGHARQMIASARPVKPILVGGSPARLMREWQQPVYFDQHGALVRQLGIQAVPALVTQEGPRLRIDELGMQP